ncbi:unnamed protein product [Discosporangium mesarthrocarpum]
MKFSKRKPLPLVAPPVKSRKRARKIVTSFHKLAREIDEEEMRISSSSKDVKVGGRNDVSRLARLRLELEANRQEYQSASLLSVGFHNTSKWVTRELTKLGLRPGKGSPPLKVLEVRDTVGAINTRLLDVPWLDVRAIDLKSQHARIEERDFFSLRPAAEYDVVASRFGQPAVSYGTVPYRTSVRKAGPYLGVFYGYSPTRIDKFASCPFVASIFDFKLSHSFQSTTRFKLALLSSFV